MRAHKRTASTPHPSGTRRLTAERYPADPADCGTLTLTSIKADRNNCIYALKSLIDNQYALYRISLHHDVTRGNAFADILSLGLSTAGTAATGAAIKTVLSAIDTGVKGTKTVINEDAFYKQSVENVINQMDADRNEDFAVMIAEMKMSTDDYTINEAKNDLIKYFYAGTWDHAITSLQTATASNSKACQTVVAQAKVTQTPPLATLKPPAKAAAKAGRQTAPGLAKADVTNPAPQSISAPTTASPTNCASQVQATAATN